MNQHGGDCVVSRYRQLVPLLSLPDLSDRHVLAAAIAARASVLITFNLPDFPEHALSPHHIRLAHPDEFAAELYSHDPRQFLALPKLHRLALRNPPKDVEQYISTLHACGLIQTSTLLRGESEYLQLRSRETLHEVGHASNCTR